MNQALNALFQLHKGAVRHDIDHPALDTGVLGIFDVDSVPGIPLFLLEAQGNPLTLAVDFQNHHFDLFTDFDHFARMRNAAPAHVGDVQQAIHPVEVHKGTELGDVLDHATTDLLGN